MPENDHALLAEMRQHLTSQLLSAEEEAYQTTLAAKNAQYARPSAPLNFDEHLGRVLSIERTARGALIRSEKGALQLSYLLPDLVQVRVRRDDQFGPLFPPGVAVSETNWPEVEPTALEDPAAIVVGAGNLAVQIGRAASQFALFAPDGTPVIQNAEPGFSWSGEAVRWSRYLPPHESAHGLGQRPYGLNLRGQTWHLWNQDTLLYARGETPSYMSIPFYLGFQEKYAVGILWDNPARGLVDLGHSQPEVMHFQAESGEVCFYVMLGITPALVLDRYTALTGRPALLPLWGVGLSSVPF
ncbi:MAG: hypothetical protein HC915_02090 [Anaerolineae bacterium]|nr:hypothetical protein [Anaerolineae bacterium]